MYYFSIFHYSSYAAARSVSATLKGEGKGKGVHPLARVAAAAAKERWTPLRSWWSTAAAEEGGPRQLLLRGVNPLLPPGPISATVSCARHAHMETYVHTYASRFISQDIRQHPYEGVA